MIGACAGLMVFSLHVQDNGGVDRHLRDLSRVMHSSEGGVPGALRGQNSEVHLGEERSSVEGCAIA